MERARVKVTRSSGNVFRDLGFAPEEAQHLLVRSELMLKIEKLLKERGLTQAAAARMMGCLNRASATCSGARSASSAPTR